MSFATNNSSTQPEDLALKPLGFWFDDQEYSDKYAQDLIDLALGYQWSKPDEETIKQLDKLKHIGFTPRANLPLCFCIIHKISPRTFRGWLNKERKSFQQTFADAYDLTGYFLSNSIDADYVRGKMKKEDHVYQMWHFLKTQTDLPKDEKEKDTTALEQRLDDLIKNTQENGAKL